MLVEERAERKKLKDQLDRISSLAERNENTLRDRTAYLEKLRMQDALDMREAKDRLRATTRKKTVPRAVHPHGATKETQYQE